LLYVEPAPEPLGAEDRRGGDAPVDALQNVEAAVLTLPRYETIREDLQRVLARNRLVARVANFTTGVEEDLYARYRAGGVEPPPERDDWAQRDRYRREGEGHKEKTENQFLVEFDVNYRLRRLRFVRDKLDRLGPLTEEALGVLGNLLPLYRRWGEEA